MKRGPFPQRIKRGSCVVTIYRTPSKGYDLFTVAHYDAGGKLCRRTFADLDQARSTAEQTAESFAGGTSDTHVLAGEELLIYRRATEALRSIGLPLDLAVIEFKRSMTRDQGVSANGAPVAVDSSSLQRAIKAVPVAQVVGELLASKKLKGRSRLYLTDLRVRLTRFADAVDRPLCEVTSNDIDKFLESLEISARSQNNFRAVIGTLLRFGQAKGYLGRDHPGISHVDKASHAVHEVQVFSKDELEKLLRTAKATMVPAVAIGAFAGVRSEELKRLTWEDVHLTEGHIEIRSAKSKTKVRRIIPIQRNLKAWLLPYAQDVGSVVPFSNLSNQFDKLARRAGVAWKKNGLRHSFISYRTAMTNNIPMVSLEAGNSPAVISRNYLKCVSPSDARRWFRIFPKKPGQNAAGSKKHPRPNNAEGWAKVGWQQMRTGSRSPGPEPGESERSVVGPPRRPGELVPLGGAGPASGQTRRDQIQHPDSSDSTA